MPEQSVLSLEELRVRSVEQSEEQRHRQLMAAHHYLGLLPKIGEALSCFAVEKPPLIAGSHPNSVHLIRPIHRLRRSDPVLFILLMNLVSFAFFARETIFSYFLVGRKIQVCLSRVFRLRDTRSQP